MQTPTPNTESNPNKERPPRVWPGMPTRRSQMFESFVMLFPALLLAIALPTMLLIALFNSCFR